ncbi:MAG: hypothetical protein M0P97_00200 [Candidatus Moranbacteria bacterium]|nr:hypothetical protein [Candidatus Moranbacteria bacterium]
MNTKIIARGNEAFFIANVAPKMFGVEFSQALLYGLRQSVLYGTEGGYIRINGTSVGIYGELAGKLRSRENVIAEVAMQIPKNVSGDLSDEIHITHCGHKFSFKITEYERDADHNFRPINDLSIIPDDEKIGRLVELTITFDDVIE